MMDTFDRVMIVLGQLLAALSAVCAVNGWMWQAGLALLLCIWAACFGRKSGND